MSTWTAYGEFVAFKCTKFRRVHELIRLVSDVCNEKEEKFRPIAVTNSHDESG